jgi:hypothetical protein
LPGICTVPSGYSSSTVIVATLFPAGGVKLTEITCLAPPGVHVMMVQSAGQVSSGGLVTLLWSSQVSPDSVVPFPHTAVVS